MKNKFNKIISNLKDDFKLEIIAFLFYAVASIAGLIMYIFFNCQYYSLKNILFCYMSAQRIGNLSTFYSIIIALYTSILVLILSLSPKLYDYLAKKDKHESLIYYFIIGICENVLIVIMCNFLNFELFFFKLTIFMLSVITLISLIKFIIIIYYIFIGQIHAVMKKKEENDSMQIDNQIEKDDRLIVLKQIEKNTRKQDK